MTVIEKYDLCYEHYLIDCEKTGENVTINLGEYMKLVPLMQINEMLKNGYVGGTKINFRRF
jgi:hypothetical protein